MKTTFQKVSELNEAFGNPKGDILQPDVAAIRKQAYLVLEEAVELMEAAHPGAGIIWEWDLTREAPEEIPFEVDMEQILDAQGDITTVNDGMGHIAGFDGDRVLGKVDDSNRTKFIPDAESVAPALQYYYTMGFKPHQLYIHGEFPLACIKVSEDCVVGGKKYPAGKFLKNMKTFIEPDFSDILAGN
ncbi:nucleoside triphosphate pyrophosphohydrolase [Erwinia phage phiEa2809]|uniref:Nucleoside triphosphate pyrophosphohydrolase n=1 Tax=Erwinia phage phiEa2809 TaxID=1564096 RepID=A0A0A0YSV3_9CAUD|nr:MazG-like pyrophosphatase [Erwinia phage phiEa2809]AIX13100.1 nucleoside triphosphate pyrophosphohydrolase [Erwinia phage phiEa2809]